MKKKAPLDSFEMKFYEGILKRSPNYVDALIPLAEVYTRHGLYDKGLEIDHRLSKLCKDDPIVFYNLACSFNLVGKEKEAILNLKKAVALGYNDFEHMRRDSDLKSLASHPYFKKLLAK